MFCFCSRIQLPTRPFCQEEHDSTAWATGLVENKKKFLSGIQAILLKTKGELYSQGLLAFLSKTTSLSLSLPSDTDQFCQSDALLSGPPKRVTPMGTMLSVPPFLDLK